jgi:hypothetical protein
MVVSDLNVGLLLSLHCPPLSVYGVALGGWASNSKFSLLGGIRGAAQMISYELALGLVAGAGGHAGRFASAWWTSSMPRRELSVHPGAAGMRLSFS